MTVNNYIKMLLELPMSIVFAGGRRREGRGKCKGRKGGRVVGKQSKEFSTNFIQTGEKEYKVGGREFYHGN